MQRSQIGLAIVALIGAWGCAPPLPSQARDALGNSMPHNKPGIAIVASGGIDGWEHVTLLDSATARYVTVTRRSCSLACAPLDSASGTLSARDVVRIYEIAASEPVLLRSMRRARCEECSDDALVTTAVFGNRRRTVIQSGREASPEVLGRVHVALAEAIRASREPVSADRD